jgi:hypothetical protein
MLQFGDEHPPPANLTEGSARLIAERADGPQLEPGIRVSAAESIESKLRLALGQAAAAAADDE